MTVWVSPIGAPHLVDPEKLVSSARRLFPNFDELWGTVTPLPEGNVRLAEGDVLGWEAFPTPGHASHHVAYARDGTLLAGSEPVPTLTLETQIRFASAKERAAFARDLQRAVERLVTRYHDDRAGGERKFTLLVAAHPEAA